MFALGVVTTFLWFMAMPAKSRQNTLLNITLTLAPLAYVGLLGSFVMTTLALSGGRALVLALLETFSIQLLPASYQPAIAFSLLVVALAVLPGGLAGLWARRRRWA